MTASGLSNEAVLDLLERMEAMAGAEAGPLQELRLANARLEADMLEFAAESARRLERVRELEEEAEGHVRELAKAEAVRLELRRAKEHSEHMEFLATQYSEQSAKLQDALETLKARVLEEERGRGEQHKAARRKAEVELSVAAPAPAGDGAAVPGGAAGGGAFSVRVRRQTVLDVHSRARTLKTAVSLLRAYAEGIFLPLARELHANTLSLAASLSARARDLRVARGSLAAALASQRLLGASLDAVYSVAFHTLARLPPLPRGAKGAFREPLPTSLTVRLREGFDNTRDLLETHAFDKVLGPELDAAAAFHELTPYLARVVNWHAVCIVVRGGRAAGKEELAVEAEYLDAAGVPQVVPGLLHRAAAFMADVYRNEAESLLKAHQADEFDLQLLQEYSEVLDDELTHFIGRYGAEEAAATAEGEDGEGEDGSGERKLSLFDVQGMLGGASLATLKAKKEAVEAAGDSEDEAEKEKHKVASRRASFAGDVDGGDGAFGAAEDGKGTEDAAEQAVIAEDEESSEDEAEEHGEEEGEALHDFQPSRSVKDVGDATKLLADALKRAAGRATVKQQELDRQASEKVARAKRLAKPGARAALGERIQEPHRVLTLVLSKRNRATDERQVGVVQLVVLGAEAEREDASTDATRFRKEHDVARHTLCQFLERKHLRQTDPGMVPTRSALTGLLSATLAPRASVVLLTAVSPAAEDFDDTIEDLRFGSRSSRQRATTAARLERVKFKWQNQSLVWAYTLWKGAVADSERIQMAHQLDNQREENEALRAEVKQLTAKLDRISEEGLAYVSDDGRAGGSGREEEGGGDDLAATSAALERAMGRDVARLKARQEGAMVQAMVSKLRYQEAHKATLLRSNRELGRMLHGERARVRARGLGASLPPGSSSRALGASARPNAARGEARGPPRAKSAMAGGGAPLQRARDGAGGGAAAREAWAEGDAVLVRDRELAGRVLAGAGGFSMDSSQLSAMQTQAMHTTLPPAHKRQAVGGR